MTSLTDQEIWDKFISINPDWMNREIILSESQLRKIVLTACKYARQSGFETGKKVTADLYKNLNPGGYNGADIFSGIFGGKK
jgi:hypothetical protein